jgi:hypothetical protein
MRIGISVAVLSLALAAPAFASADSFNQISAPDIRTGSSDMGWSYNWNSSDGAKQVLAQLRTVCKSSNRYDQRRCAKGTAILKDAYAELQARRAAEGVIAD